MAGNAQYRLQTLLELREKRKDEAEQYLSECLQNLKQEQERLREMEAELERMIAKREAKKREYAEKQMRGEMDAQGAIAANTYIDRLKEQEQAQENAIEGQMSVVAEKKQEVEGARQDLLDASQQLKALEKHKEKWQQEQKKERERRQEEALDELTQAMYSHRHD